MISCGGEQETTDPSIVEQIPQPNAVSLIAPENNSVCNGVDKGETLVTVIFNWSSVTYAEHYTLFVFNADGSEHSRHQTPNTSVEVDLQRNTSFSWNVTSSNDTGSSISVTRNGTTPGTSQPNAIPTIVSIQLNEDEHIISIIVKDNDGDRLYFDALSANNSDFNDATEYFSNEEIEGSKDNSSEQQIQIENVEWTSSFWFRIILRDEQENTIIETISRKF